VSEQHEEEKKYIKKLVGIFSDFIMAFVGWICLYVLIANLLTNSNSDNFNIFLGTIALLSISGYGYKIASKLLD
jgi:hypothetical protein